MQFDILEVQRQEAKRYLEEVAEHFAADNDELWRDAFELIRDGFKMGFGKKYIMPKLLTVLGITQEDVDGFDEWNYYRGRD
jgi:hypothetical protein